MRDKFPAELAADHDRTKAELQRVERRRSDERAKEQEGYAGWRLNPTTIRQLVRRAEAAGYSSLLAAAVALGYSDPKHMEPSEALLFEMDLARIGRQTERKPPLDFSRDEPWDFEHDAPIGATDE